MWGLILCCRHCTCTDTMYDFQTTFLDSSPIPPHRVPCTPAIQTVICSQMQTWHNFSGRMQTTDHNIARQTCACISTTPPPNARPKHWRAVRPHWNHVQMSAPSTIAGTNWLHKGPRPYALCTSHTYQSPWKKRKKRRCFLKTAWAKEEKVSWTQILPQQSVWEASINRNLKQRDKCDERG